MGFNTVAFLLNDFMSEVERSPRTAVWLLTHPPIHGGVVERDQVRRDAFAVAREHGEPPLTSQALVVLPTFHADGERFYFASRNRIEELGVLRRARTSGRRTVTLVLPDEASSR